MVFEQAARIAGTIHDLRIHSDLVIEVVNNGKRLSQDDLARLRSMLDERQPADGHLGVRNVNQRLKLIFGEHAGLTFDVDAHGNTVASIHQPLQPIEQESAKNRK